MIPEITDSSKLKKEQFKDPGAVLSDISKSLETNSTTEDKKEEELKIVQEK